MDIKTVRLSNEVIKKLRKLSPQVTIKLRTWVDSIAHGGLAETRKVPGYHDEPLKGKRQGQRSIRLSKAYRAIYKVDSSLAIHFVEIIEVNKHEY